MSDDNKTTAENAAETAEGKAEGAWDKTKDVAGDVANKAGDVASNAWDKVKDAAETVAEKSKAVVSEVSHEHKAEDGTADTRGVFEKVADAITGDKTDDKTGKKVE